MRIFENIYRSVAERKDEISPDKTEGIHLYVNVDNLDLLVNSEEDDDEEIKRTIHMLNTFYDGITYIVKLFDGYLEKLTKGRAHFYFEFEEDEFGNYSQEEKTKAVNKVIQACIAIYTYNYSVFNNIGKYSNYDNFKISGGIDVGKYYKYNILINNDETEFTTIGSVANIAAKLQSFAHGRQIVITESLYDLLEEELVDIIEPEEISGDQKTTLEQKTQIEDEFYKINYSSSKNSAVDNMETIMEDVEERSTEKANEVNLSDMSYSNLYSKLDFSSLSIRNNKKVEGVILFSDIRGFTKLFMEDDSNLDQLFLAMQSIYDLFQEVVDEYDGTRVQFQGDRLVAIFNDYNEAKEVSYIRSIKVAAAINSKINEFNELNIIDEDIAVGTGISYGNMIATRTGMDRNKDNLTTSKVTSRGNKAEDEHAIGDFDIVAYKSLKENWEEDESAWSKVILDLFESINTTGYYKSKEYLDLEKLNEKYDEELQKSENTLKDFAFSDKGTKNRQGVMPWRK